MTKPQIIKRLSYWKSILGLDNWEIEVAFEKDKDTEEGELGRCTPDSSYFSAFIVFNPKRLRDVNDNVIVHELLHCLTSEMKSYMVENGKKDSWTTFFDERLVSQLASIIVRLNK